MRTLIITPILISWLMIFSSSIVFGDTNQQTSIGGTNFIGKNESAQSEVEPTSTIFLATNPPLAVAIEKNKRVVAPTTPVDFTIKDNTIINSKPSVKEAIEDKKLVVGRTPEFYSYILSSISVLLTVITILVGVITGVGLAIVIKLYRERKKLEETRSELDKEQESARNKLKQDYEKMTEALERTAFRLASFHTSKRDLRDILSTSTPPPSKVYLLLEKTVRYPDSECLELYSKALMTFETNVDIIRMVRNGIMQFSRSPDKV